MTETRPPTPPIPPALLGFSEPVVRVTYEGPLVANFRIRGAASEYPYVFAGRKGARSRWVLERDLSRFDVHAEFQVERAVRLAPPEERTALAERVAALEARAQLRERKPGPGRPPVDRDQCVRFFHLHVHCPRAWSVQQLADKFFAASRHGQPARAVRYRLRQAEERYGLSADTSCQYCTAESCPPPP